MPCEATQDGQVVVERSDRLWSTGAGNGKPLQYSCLENPMYSMKRQNDRTLKEELPRSVGAQYATGDQWRNNYRKNKGMEPKQKQYPVVNVTSDRSKVRCCKEQFKWNVSLCFLITIFFFFSRAALKEEQRPLKSHLEIALNICNCISS